MLPTPWTPIISPCISPTPDRKWETVFSPVNLGLHTQTGHASTKHFIHLAGTKTEALGYSKAGASVPLRCSCSLDMGMSAHPTYQPAGKSTRSYLFMNAKSNNRPYSAIPWL